ncbi:inactive serine/threonine-protein kinase TEX14-like isoform X2 [Hoplias malabaricus]|uniref:inactive serine/threonine-protein kinase TEX14-like isoform X2 n=1 Tax=Hoplias malabaricus TaxID=27720 RepID=UPI0034631A6F
MPAVPPVPCPIRLGTVKCDGPPALLHTYTLERNARKLEKLLKKGADVDSENDLGQTPLFCASLLGFANIVELLLQHGADPNRRCKDRSTPVHAAVFSCNPWLLSSLLDAGGDLRLHDDRGQAPADWAEAGAQEHSPRMLDFLKSCASHMWSLTQRHSPREGRVTPTSSKTLLRSPSLLELLRSGGSDLLINKKLSSQSSVCDSVQCFGYGKLCVEKSHHAVGVLACVPLIADSELSQAEDEALYSFTCGAFCCMTNYSWRGCRVTVKELKTEDDLYKDLLTAEMEHSCRLFHPNLLQLMAVSITTDLQRSKLVYERVNVGSLYTLLYHRRSEFPLLQVCELLALVLQVCESVLYLHSRALVLRALSSHSVVIIHPGVAKVTGLGFTVPSEAGCSGRVSPLPLPAELYNWAAPEVVRRRTCTEKADLYSICSLIQEIFTDAVPWGSVDPRWIKQAVDAGQALPADPAVPQPYYQLLHNGLQPRARDRTCSLQDVRYTLRRDLEELSDRRSRSGERPLSGKWSPALRTERKPEEPGVQPADQFESRSLLDQEIQNQLQNLDQILENETEPSSPRKLRNADTESSTDAEELHLESSHRGILPLDRWRLSLCPLVDRTDGSEDTMSSCSTVEEDVATQAPDAISEHISSIVLNLKVSQVLLQQVESSLQSAELGLSHRPESEGPESGVSADEVDGGMSKREDEVDGGMSEREDEVDGVMSRKREWKVVVLKAVGPPPSYRPPQEWSSDGEEEASCYFLATEDSCLSPEEVLSVSLRDRNTDWRQRQPIRNREESDSSYRSSAVCEPQQKTTPSMTDHAQPKWTSEVCELVVRMTQGRWGQQGSSEVEQVEKQQHHLEDTHWHHNCTQLEQLFKSFSGVRSESEESADFHTFVPQESTEGEVESGSESEGRESPAEPSSVFYTPKHRTEPEELSQTLSSEEGLDVTMEVCRPNTTVTDLQSTEHFRECRSVPEEPEQTGPEPGTSAKETLQTTSQVTDIADFSSITCSPTQLHEGAGPEGAPPDPHRTRYPPCHSTPRSPDTCTGSDGGPVPRSHESIPLLLDTSPWDSAPNCSICTENYATANLDTRHTTNRSECSVLQGDVSTERDTPATGNLEFTTASSATKHTTTEKDPDTRTAQDTETLGCAVTAGSEGAEAVSEEVEEEVDGEPSESALSVCSESPDHSAALSEMRKGEEGVDGDGLSAEQRRSTGPPESLEETERAHSTLDEVLNRLLEETENQGTAREPDVCDVEVREECVCPAGDRLMGAVCKGAEGISSGNFNTHGEKKEAELHSNRCHLHRVIFLDQTPVKTRSEPNQRVSAEPLGPP